MEILSGRGKIPEVSTEPTVDVFFAYPGRSQLLAETMRSTAAKLDERSNSTVQTWEDLAVDGRLVIGEITGAIDAATLVVAEITHLNANVLFEVGYALASDKQIVLALDNSELGAHDNWKALGVLSSIGYTGYDGSSDELMARIAEREPEEKSLWEDLLVQGDAGPQLPNSLFYVPLGNRADASRTVDRSLKARKHLLFREADEDEQGLAPMPWYAAQIYQSSAALLHLRGPQRSRHEVHNTRASLFARNRSRCRSTNSPSRRGDVRSTT